MTQTEHSYLLEVPTVITGVDLLCVRQGTLWTNIYIYQFHRHDFVTSVTITLQDLFVTRHQHST